ncbi:MAG: M15 family metallopeptidase [Clostridia bacterium]|nr:M15 family metallopeptidase [Clostridia bacterium]
MTEKRKKAIKRRRIFMAVLIVVFIALESAMIAAIVAVVKNSSKNKTDNTSVVSDEQTPSSENPSGGDNTDSSDVSSAPSKPDLPDTFVTPTGITLDANFGRLLLINGENPLPDDYDTKVREYLVEIDDEYRNNDYVTQIHREVYPYITAMVAAAQAEGVDLQVWSPFRSYAIQNDLFKAQVNRVGGDEEKAATVVARPGTSEHNTGLCADFNMASDRFESTEMYTWMCENAEDYGFILRYPKDKQSVTGVIYESWHWRFVGINNAKEINDLGVTLEEYIDMKGIDPTVDMYTDD